MCRSCEESPTNIAIRCQRKDGFSAEEGESRTRTRGLNTLIDGLANGDEAAAARGANRAVTAQDRLDLMADPDNLPSRKLLVSPGDARRVAVEFEKYQRENPGSKTRFEVGERVIFAQGDMETGTKWTEITVYDADPGTLGNRIPLNGVSTQGVPVVSVYGVLNASFTHIERHDGYQKAGAPNSTPASVIERFSMPPVERRKTMPYTGSAMKKTIPAREYLTELQPTSEYEKKIKALAAKDFIEYSEIPLMASAAAHYAKNKPSAQAPAPGPGKWIGNLGQDAYIAGKVTRNFRTNQVDQRNGGDRHFVTVETPEGDVIQVGATNVTAAEGDMVTLSGSITEHTWYRERRRTFVSDGQITPHEKPEKPTGTW